MAFLPLGNILDGFKLVSDNEAIPAEFISYFKAPTLVFNGERPNYEE